MPSSITLTASGLKMLGGAEIASSTFGLGNGGSVNVSVARRAVLSGVTHESSDFPLSSPLKRFRRRWRRRRFVLTAGSLRLLARSRDQLLCRFSLGNGGVVNVSVAGQAMLSGTDATGAAPVSSPGPALSA